MLKKTVAFVLAAIMVMMMCGTGSADNAHTSGLYTYEFKGNGTVVITGFDWKHNTDNIYIPALIDGYPVTAIANNAFEATSQTKVGNYVVTLSSGITEIGEFAFLKAPVSTINIPDSVVNIGKGAFLTRPQSGFIHFNVAPKHTVFATINGVLFNKKERKLIAFPIRDYDLFHGENEMIWYEIPEGIKAIDDYAFSSVLGSKGSITIPNSVTAIGCFAFANYQGSITWEQGTNISIIGEHAFGKSERPGIQIYGVIENLAQLSIIPSFCFENDTIWSNFTIPSSVVEIQDHAFYCSYLRNVRNSDKIVIPGNVKTIGDYAFCLLEPGTGTECKEIVIQSGVQKIGKYSFSEIKKITSVTIEEGLSSIDDGAFIDCPSLISVTVPSTVSHIGKDVFDKQKVTLTVVQGSYAEHYAIENGLQFKYAESEDDLSWLYGDIEATETEEESTDWLNP